MRKDEAVQGLEQAGEAINELYTRAWATALYPTHHGWGASIGSIVAIPVLSLASIGRVVSSAVVQQVPEEVFDKLSGEKPREP